jgi:hypothetical protein
MHQQNRTRVIAANGAPNPRAITGNHAATGKQGFEPCRKQLLQNI